MKQLNETTGTPASTREAYEAPTCEIIEIENEGNILVGSNTGHDGFEDGDDVEWGF